MMVIVLGTLVGHRPFPSAALYAKHEARVRPSPPIPVTIACPVGGDAPGTEARRRAAFLFPPHDSAGRSDQGAGAAQPLVAPAKKRLSACGRTFRFFPVTTP